jgi:cell division protein FtsB
MIPCKMPDERLPVFTEITDLLQHACELSQRLLEDANNNDQQAQYQQLVLDVTNLKDKVMQLHDQAKKG